MVTLIKPDDHSECHCCSRHRANDHDSQMTWIGSADGNDFGEPLLVTIVVLTSYSVRNDSGRALLAVYRINHVGSHRGTLTQEFANSADGSLGLLLHEPMTRVGDDKLCDVGSSVAHDERFIRTEGLFTTNGENRHGQLGCHLKALRLTESV
jgi:hypothetical protein